MTRPLDNAELEGIAQRAADLVAERQQAAMLERNRAAFAREMDEILVIVNERTGERTTLPWPTLDADDDDDEGWVPDDSWNDPEPEDSPDPDVRYATIVDATLAILERSAASFDTDPPRRPLWKRLTRRR